MDLLGDLGSQDQLISVREENKVLKQKVKELSNQISELTIEKHSLLAEVELYRKEKAASAGDSNKLNGDGGGGGVVVDDNDNDEDAFIKSGNGIYTCEVAVTLSNLHVGNPLCCALNKDDTLIATGGADSYLSLCQWGIALSSSSSSSSTEAGSSSPCEKAVLCAGKLKLDAPVICTSFGQSAGGGGFGSSSSRFPVVAAGCMDGSVHVASYYIPPAYSSPSSSTSVVQVYELFLHNNNNNEKNNNNNKKLLQHDKYVKCMAWSPTEPILASGSADGTIRLTKLKSKTGSLSYVLDDYNEKKNASEAVGGAAEAEAEADADLELEEIVTLHLSGAIESLAFLDNGNALCCYSRGTSYLSCFDLKKECKQTKISLNSSTVGSGGFDDHVSFAIMDLIPSPGSSNSNFLLAAATDSNRNIILDYKKSGKQIRNLYGHENDSYSQPKIGWSFNGQYLYGNTQHDGTLCIWDIASSNIVKRLGDKEGGHSGNIRDMYSSPNSDILVTTSYDKTVKVWLPPAPISM